MRFLRLLATGLLAAPLAIPAAADSRLETIVVTGSRTPVELKDQAGNTSVLDQATLELVGHTHIQESLARVPGVNIARGNGLEYLPALRSPVLTGAGACGSVLAAVDGVPLRAAGFCNINELFEAPTEMAGRIEVVRGPGSALFGSNAMHGVINVITAEVPAERLLQLGVEGGPHDFGRVSLSAGQRWGEHGARADLITSHDGGYRDDSGYDQQKLLLRHEYDGANLALTTTLLAANLNQETAGYVEGTDAYEDAALKRSNPNPEAYRDARSLRVASRLEYSLANGNQLLVTPYYRDSEMTFLQHFLPGKPVEENTQQSLGLQAAHFYQRSEQLELVTGVDLEYTRGSLLQYQDGPTQGSAFLQATIPSGRHYDYQVNALTAATFVQASWRIDDRLSATAGLRYERVDYDYDNQMLAGRTADDGTPCGFGGCRYARPADRDDDFENWSPKLGVLFQFNPRHQLYLNITQGFRAPQATELYRLQREQQVAELDSEQLDSVEIGLRGEQQPLSYELVLFAMKTHNVLFRDSDFFNVADGATRSHGLELALSYALGEDWELAFAASYAEHEYRDDRELGGVQINGNEIDSAPTHFGSVRLGWNFSESGRSELEWVHQGDYFTDPENLHSYPGHEVLNLRTLWRLTERLSLHARITNLADEDYAERADYTSFSGDRYFPGEGRSLFLGAQLRF